MRSGSWCKAVRHLHNLYAFPEVLGRELWVQGLTIDPSPSLLAHLPQEEQ